MNECMNGLIVDICKKLTPACCVVHVTLARILFANNPIKKDSINPMEAASDDSLTGI